MLYILDYGAGNVRSLANSIEKLGFQFRWVESPSDLENATSLLFPGVGAFGQAMESLHCKGYSTALRTYIESGKPYMGICIGMQALFSSSSEAPDVHGLGIIPSSITRFTSKSKTVPHIGWNGAVSLGGETPTEQGETYYYVHSYKASFNPEEEWTKDWASTITKYGDEEFVSSVRRGNVFATQFHPEKSGLAGLRLLDRWLQVASSLAILPLKDIPHQHGWAIPNDLKNRLRKEGLTKRIVAALDVRTNDQGDLVVTKGDQYDVREKVSEGASNNVRNLGKPVDLAKRYYEDGADEICFLNITSFRSCPLVDQPMLDVVKLAAQSVFIPLTIGGGIRDTVDPDGKVTSALEVAGLYFRQGADKVSIGGDAVDAVESLLRDGECKGTSGIETISRQYGRQAVVVSVDPKRVYVDSPQSVDEKHRDCVVDLSSSDFGEDLGPNGERYCWYQCTVKGGREVRDIDVVQLCRGVEKLGAGEILLNSVDKDGTKKGFDCRLINMVQNIVKIPIIASSGAGSEKHFEEVFTQTDVEAALAAGIFHRNEVPLPKVKDYLMKTPLRTRVQR